MSPHKNGSVVLAATQITKAFDDAHSRCADIITTLGADPEYNILIRNLKQKAAALGRLLQRIGRANLKSLQLKNPLDPEVPNTLTPDEFLRHIRRAVWDSFDDLRATEDWEPDKRLAFLRRRSWNRGRRLELISKAYVVDREELLRIIALGEAQGL